MQKRAPSRCPLRLSKPVSFVISTSSGQGRDRTADTQIFSLVLYQLSYLAAFRAGVRAQLAPAPSAVSES